MLQLLEKYSLSEILVFLVIISLALKGTITFFDWLREKMREIVYKEQRPQKIENKVSQIEKKQGIVENTLDNIIVKLDVLIKSDREAIKAYITQKHHYFVYDKKWIDDYTMNVLQKRYQNYKAEEGNSFIRGLMDELRALPKKPPMDRR